MAGDVKLTYPETTRLLLRGLADGNRLSAAAAAVGLKPAAAHDIARGYGYPDLDAVRAYVTEMEAGYGMPTTPGVSGPEVKVVTSPDTVNVVERAQLQRVLALRDARALLGGVENVIGLIALAEYIMTGAIPVTGEEET